MKKLLYILPLAAAVVFTSCGDDDENNGPKGAATGGLSAKVNGTQWTSGADDTYAQNSDGSFIIGSNNNSETASQSLSVSMWEEVSSVGTYTGADVRGKFLVADTASIQIWESSGNATLTITKIDANKVSGTFSFTAQPYSGGATGTKTITEGSFTDVAID